MRVAALLTTIFLLLIAVSCEPKITEGTVIEKKHCPSSVYLQPIFTGKTTILMPVTTPETWWVVIEKDGVKEDFSINREDFEKVTIGQELKIDTDKKKKKR